MSNKWSGVIGYSKASEVRPGVYDYDITERKHVGDLVRNTRRTEDADRIVDERRLNNSVSLVADAFLMQNFADMVYITMFGTKWRVTTVEVVPPRLILQIGGVYNGPQPTPPAE